MRLTRLIGIAALVVLQLCPLSEAGQTVGMAAHGPIVSGTSSGGTPSSEGNLTMDVGCSVTAEWPAYCFTLNLDLTIEGEPPVHEQQASCESWGLTAMRYGVRASLFNRQVTCFASSPYGQFGGWGYIPGAGPNVGSVQIKAFIPYEYVVHPYDWVTLLEGDYRGFQPYGGSSRMFTLFESRNSAVNNSLTGAVHHEAGLTATFDRDTSLDVPPFGHLTQEARDDWTPGLPMKTDWAFASLSSWCSNAQATDVDREAAESTVSFHCSGSGSNPLVVLSAPIRWELDVTLTYGNNKVKYAVSGCASAFPAIEIYGNGNTMHLNYDSGDPTDLLFGCSEGVSFNGEFQ